MLTILLTAALAGLWDDETNLGRGPAIGAGVGVAMTRAISAEVEVGRARLRRDSGYLEASSVPWQVHARLRYTLREPSRRTRPYVTAGVTWVRAQGSFTTHRTAVGPDGRPEAGEVERQPWRIRAAGPAFGVGVEIRTMTRLTLRPELRVFMTRARDPFEPRDGSALEPPFVGYAATIVAGWR